MPVPIIMPKFNNLQEESIIVKWFVREGADLQEGDPVCEVETDKVNMEVEAPDDGVLARILYDVGDTVPVTKVIAYLLQTGETPADLPEPEPAVSSPPPATPTTAAQPKISPVAQRIAEANAINVQRIEGSGPGGRIMRRDVERQTESAPGKVRATPAARHLARLNKIELVGIAGSGPNGRIQQADVENALNTTPSLAPGDRFQPEVVPQSKMRRTIAARMQTSAQTAPHIFVETQVEAGKLDELRLHLKEQGERLTVTAVLAKACAVSLRKHPRLNATHENDSLHLWPVANIGIAVSLKNGLVVPVIKRVEAKPLQQIQTELDDLSDRARQNRLTGEDVAAGTFTISNMGMLGVTRFTAIINQPQVAILAVGTAVKQFLPDANNQPVLRSLITLTLSVDHRFIDGAEAASFLADLKLVLEEPALLAW